MLRGWIVVIACISCGTASAQAQQSRAPQRRAAPQGYYLQDDVEYYAPSQGVQQAAAATPTGRPPVAARERSMQQASRKPSSGGLMGKFRLPNLIPKVLRGEGGPQEESRYDSEPPMPYDEAELQDTPQRQSAARPARQPSSPQRQQMAPQRQPSTAGRQQMAGQPAPSRPAVEARPAPPAASRVARSSPTTGARRNELAEALAGLGDSNSEELSTSPESSASVADADAQGEMVAPTADDAADAPSYVDERAARPSTAAASRRPAAQAAQRPAPRRATAERAVDVRDALMSDGSVNDEIAARAADAASQESDDPVNSLAKPRPPAPRASAPRTAVAPTTPVAKEIAQRTIASGDFAEALQAKPRTSPSPAPASREAADDVAAAPTAPANRATVVETKPTVTASRSSTLPSAISSPGLRPQREVLYSAKQPVIHSNIEGPQQIVVGRKATYRVTLENKGDVSARDLTAVIAAPVGAEVVDAAASNGEVQHTPVDGVAAKEIKWQLYELSAGSSQTLTLELIPRSGREMQLGVQWSHAPVTGQATVLVQEPKLAMEIAGPGEVQFGKSQRYSLVLSNPGNGAAEDVTIELTPPGGSQDSMVRHKVGTLAAGESKKIELELTAREAGELNIKAAAMAAGDLRTEVVKSVLCRKAELEIDWRGPDQKFAGASATYFLRVRNPGTATADDVTVEVNLPAGAELIKASEGHEWDADRRAITWKAGAIAAGEEKFLQVDCRLSQPGVNNMELSAQTAKGDLSDVKTVPVMVEALADLKLEVIDPKGVVPVGEMAVYEIHIKNHGLIAAKGIEVVAMFSEGVEPSHVEGGQHSIRDGRVAFRPIDELAAGGETVLRIHAKATASGTHVFRAEVSCQELEAKLAAEETTRFFTEEERWADASTAYAEEGETQTR